MIHRHRQSVMTQALTYKVFNISVKFFFRLSAFINITLHILTSCMIIIKEKYPDCIIIKEIFTGIKHNRPEWEKLIKKVKKNDTIVFDEVSRMSRNAVEGFETYKEMLEKGINLVFLKEKHK